MNIEKTQVKFALSEETGKIIGFVSRNSKTKKLKGVRENSAYGKKIVVLAEEMKGRVEPNLLYNVDLKEMHNGGGFVCIGAELVKFTAVIEQVVEKKKIYQIRVSFGNKTIYFDPVSGRSPSSRTIEGVMTVLNARKDIEDLEDVAVEFQEKAVGLVEILLNDGLPYQPVIPFEK